MSLKLYRFGTLVEERMKDYCVKQQMPTECIQNLGYGSFIQSTWEPTLQWTPWLRFKYSRNRWKFLRQNPFLEFLSLSANYFLFYGRCEELEFLWISKLPGLCRLNFLTVSHFSVSECSMSMAAKSTSGPDPVLQVFVTDSRFRIIGHLREIPALREAFLSQVLTLPYALYLRSETSIDLELHSSINGFLRTTLTGESTPSGSSSSQMMEGRAPVEWQRLIQTHNKSLGDPTWPQKFEPSFEIPPESGPR